MELLTKSFEIEEHIITIFFKEKLVICVPKDELDRIFKIKFDNIDFIIAQLQDIKQMMSNPDLFL